MRIQSKAHQQRVHVVRSALEVSPGCFISLPSALTLLDDLGQRQGQWPFFLPVSWGHLEPTTVSGRTWHTGTANISSIIQGTTGLEKVLQSLDFGHFIVLDDRQRPGSLLSPGI